MNLPELISFIKANPIEVSLRHFLYRSTIPAFQCEDDYRVYKEFVQTDHPSAEQILVCGSGNWGYSFNPNKLFRRFSQSSDIDLVIVSAADFNRAWESLRHFHRNNWYSIGRDNQFNLRRNGENVYSGFISPKWIHDYYSPERILYEERVNKYSNDLVGFRVVNLMYFKNLIELHDYYQRSFLVVRRSNHGI